MVQATPTTIGGGGTGRVQLHEGQDPFTPPRAELNLRQERSNRLGVTQAQVHATPAPHSRAQTESSAGVEAIYTDGGGEILPEGPGTRNDAAAAATMNNLAGAAVSSASAGAEAIPGVGGGLVPGTHPGTDDPTHQDEINQEESEELDFPPLHLSGPKKSTKRKTPKGKKSKKK